MTRVISERTVCYCSNFDLDAGEWFRLYINLRLFSRNLQQKLGKFDDDEIIFSENAMLEHILIQIFFIDENWHQYLREAVCFKELSSVPKR